MESARVRLYYIGASISLIGLILLGLAWEIFIAPLQPGRYWMALKVVPLLFPLRGVLKRDVYTMQWASMLILLYFMEGIVRATSDRTAVSALLGWIEVALSAIYFTCSLLYLRPYKKAAKQMAKQIIEKVSR